MFLTKEIPHNTLAPQVERCDRLLIAYRERYALHATKSDLFRFLTTPSAERIAFLQSLRCRIDILSELATNPIYTP